MMREKLDTVLSRFRSLSNEKDFRLSFLHHLEYTRGKDLGSSTLEDKYSALALAVRDRMTSHMIATQQAYSDRASKRLYYFSMEFLIGRILTSNLVNLGILPLVREALDNLGCTYEELAQVERDAALGNGGLGRLAACYMESLATHGYPAYGYGILYEYGLFRQEIRNGFQRERPDYWMEHGSPWLLSRPEHSVTVPVYGRIEHGEDRAGGYNPMWLDWNVIMGEPNDIPVVGFGGRTVNLLRLFKAKASADFEIEIFNAGDYVEAVRQKVFSENISKILYPADSSDKGRELRLLQEYFMVACGVRDILRRFRKASSDWSEFPERVAIQMNDTHPSLVVPELQRFFVDEAGLPWDKAWDLVQRTCGYTNHTLMPEALERWPVHFMERILPRHLQVIYEINRRFLDGVRTAIPGDEALIQRVSLVEEAGERRVRMAHLAVVGSHAVNGVAKLHTRLLRDYLLADFDRIFPGRIRNVTNGVTQRRWLLVANPELSALITRLIGPKWITDLEHLTELLPWAEDRDIHARLREIKEGNKRRLAALIPRASGLNLSPLMMFDVQAKRLHEYKRQLLNALHIIDLYLDLKENPASTRQPRVCLFAAKAAPGYGPAKLIIKFINNLSHVINADREVRDRLQVYFLPDYRVSLAEVLIPAADLSEQISLAGTEASGTGNMKFALNGALTIGTLDGANVEMAEAIGAENMFIFGLTADQVLELRRKGYSSRDYYARIPRLQAVIKAIADNRFSINEHGIFEPLLRSIFEAGDLYMLFADYEAYAAAQLKAEATWKNGHDWYRKVILNIAHMGRFSSDRAVREYADTIWHITPEEVPMEPIRL